jgi:hypothetical protein
MTEREKILGRVREALKTPAAMPGSHESRAVVPPAKLNAAWTAALPLARQWLPEVGESFEEQLALFQKNAAELKADFQLLASRDELKTAIAKISKGVVGMAANFVMHIAERIKAEAAN